VPTEEKHDDTKNSFYEELEQVFDHFPKYHMKIMLGDFNAKLGRQDIFKPTIWNEGKLSIWSRLEIRMQDKMGTYR
jgi:exonuclease III